MEPQLERFVSTLKEWLTVDDIIQNIEGCLGCGNCSQACAWYLETSDERLRPKFRSDFIREIYRRYLTPEGKVLGRMGIYPSPTVEDLRKNMDVYWKCTACGRCTLACPRGISNRRLVRIARAAYTNAGLSQENPTIKSIIDNTERLRHSFGLTQEEIFGKIGLFLNYEGVEIPIEVYGAEYLFICPAAGNTKIPEYGIKLPKLLNVAGISYTVSTKVLDTGTEVDHIAVHHGLAKKMLIEIEEEAQRLGVEKVFIAECGCDVRSFYVDATETLGRPFKYPIVSIDTVLHEAIDSGILPVEPVDYSVTFHDPCYVTRLSGLGEHYREFLSKIVKEFLEMTPNREYNYCCNAGSGGMRLPEQEGLYRKVSRIKAEQIKNSGAEIVTTPCAVCYLSLKNITEAYGIASNGERRARVFFEIIYDAVEKALNRRGEYHRVKMPAVLKGKDAFYLQDHTIAGMMQKLQDSPVYPALLDKLSSNPNVINYGMENPGFFDYLEQMAGQGVGG